MAGSALRSSHEIPGPILVVAAHPDDIEVHCGGTLAQLVAQGKPLTCVLCTSGNRGTDNGDVTMDEIGTSREREQRAASDILGVKHVRFLRHDDGDLAFIVPQLREEIVRVIREVRPRTVITHDPYPGDGGQDSCSIYPDHTTWHWSGCSCTGCTSGAIRRVSPSYSGSASCPCSSRSRSCR